MYTRLQCIRYYDLTFLSVKTLMTIVVPGWFDIIELRAQSEAKLSIIPLSQSEA